MRNLKNKLKKRKQGKQMENIKAQTFKFVINYNFWSLKKLKKFEDIQIFNNFLGFGKVSSHISAQIKYAQIFEDICEDVCEDSLTEIKNLNYFDNLF